MDCERDESGMREGERRREGREYGRTGGIDRLLRCRFMCLNQMMKKI